MLVIVPTGGVLQAFWHHSPPPTRSAPFCFSFPPEMHPSSASWQAAALLIGTVSLTHTGTPLPKTGDAEVRLTAAYLAQAWPGGPSAPSIISISPVQVQPNLPWRARAIAHIASSWTGEMGEGSGPRTHLAREARALQCLPTRLSRASPLLCSYQ